MSGENTVSSDEKTLDVEALLVVAAKAKDDYENYRDTGWSADYAADVSLLIAEAERLTAERDRARSIAVALEQELARKDQALDEIRALVVGPWPGYRVTVESIERILSDLAAALDAQLNKEDDGE